MYLVDLLKIPSLFLSYHQNMIKQTKKNLILIKLKKSRLCIGKVTLTKWSLSKSFSKCPKQLCWKWDSRKEWSHADDLITVLSFLQAPSPRNYLIRQGSLWTTRDLLFVILHILLKPLLQRLQSGFLGRQANYSLAWVKRQHALSVPHMGKRTKSLRTLTTCWGKRQRVTAAPFMDQYFPLLSHCKEWAVVRFRFSWDFVFISLAEFRRAETAWSLNRLKSWLDLKKARKYSLEVNTSSLTHIFVPFLLIPFLQSQHHFLHTDTHTHTTMC